MASPGIIMMLFEEEVADYEPESPLEASDEDVVEFAIDRAPSAYEDVVAVKASPKKKRSLEAHMLRKLNALSRRTRNRAAKQQQQQQQFVRGKVSGRWTFRPSSPSITSPPPSMSLMMNDTADATPLPRASSPKEE